ncbi:MAG: hypothetical protein NPIRA04_22380 [Nitrospirales bacterium]|nr:MAG: hypothetical protein NPIRA04_22380 [Nitrospirales bacterium]
MMTIASLIAGSFVWTVNFQIINDNQKLSSNNTLLLLQSDIWREHLNFGKWLLLGSIPNWLSKIAFIPLLGALLGLSQAGAFRALQNLILPVQQVLVAIGLFFLPWLSKSKEKKSAVFFQKSSKNITWISLSIVLVYVIPLILFGEEVLQWLYQNEYYQSVSFLLPLFVLVALLSSITQAWGTMFKAMEWTYGIFLSKLIGALVTLSISWVLVIYLGLLGAVIGLLLSVLTEVCVLFFIKNKFSGRLGEDEENTQPLPYFIDRRNNLRSSNF